MTSVCGHCKGNCVRYSWHSVMKLRICRASFSLISAKKTRMSFILRVLWKLNFFDSVKHIALRFLQTSFKCGKLHCLPLILKVFVDLWNFLSDSAYSYLLCTSSNQAVDLWNLVRHFLIAFSVHELLTKYSLYLYDVFWKLFANTDQW